jgi:predicted fused transcriptional regulator/phosphomethylpyrimidine kinase
VLCRSRRDNGRQIVRARLRPAAGCTARRHIAIPIGDVNRHGASVRLAVNLAFVAALRGSMRRRGRNRTAINRTTHRGTHRLTLAKSHSCNGVRRGIVIASRAAGRALH